MFYEECSEFLDERKRAILEWLQDPGTFNANNPKNMRSETN